MACTSFLQRRYLRASQILCILMLIGLFCLVMYFERSSTHLYSSVRNVPMIITGIFAVTCLKPIFGIGMVSEPGKGLMVIEIILIGAILGVYGGVAYIDVMSGSMSERDQGHPLFVAAVTLYFALRKILLYFLRRTVARSEQSALPTESASI